MKPDLILPWVKTSEIYIDITSRWVILRAFLSLSTLNSWFCYKNVIITCQNEQATDSVMSAYTHRLDGKHWRSPRSLPITFRDSTCFYHGVDAEFRSRLYQQLYIAITQHTSLLKWITVFRPENVRSTAQQRPLMFIICWYYLIIRQNNGHPAHFRSCIHLHMFCF